MNTLTTKRPKEIIPQRIVDRYLSKKELYIEQFNPTVEQCKQIAHDAFRIKMYNTMSTALKALYRDYNALLINAAPKFEAIKKHVDTLKLTREDFEQMYTTATWNSMKRSVQNRHLAGADLDTIERKQELKYVQMVFDAMTKLSVEIDDEMYEEYEAIGESVASFALDRIDTHILPDFDKKEATAMRASDIYRYLLPRSKGTIQQTPQQLANLLPALGYEYFERRVKGKPVKYYYVELVK